MTSQQLTGNGTGGAAFAGGDHDKHLHDIVVDPVGLEVVS
jgi:hypothetical protein